MADLFDWKIEAELLGDYRRWSEQQSRSSGISEKDKAFYEDLQREIQIDEDEVDDTQHKVENELIGSAPQPAYHWRYIWVNLLWEEKQGKELKSLVE